MTYPIYNWRGRRNDNPSGYVVDTLRTVLQSLMNTGSFEECLIDVVNRGGDGRHRRHAGWCHLWTGVSAKALATGT